MLFMTSILQNMLHLSNSKLKSILLQNEMNSVMTDIKNSCFVCKEQFTPKILQLNLTVNLQVCEDCKGTDKERQTEKEYLESLADGFVCGCI